MKYAIAYMITKFYYLYTLIVRCRLVVGTLLTSAVSDDKQARQLKLPWSCIVRIKTIFFLRYMLRSQGLFGKQLDKELQKIAKHISKSQQNVKAEMDIPTFEFGEISSEQFFNEYVKYGRPAVFKNVPSEARDQWSHEFFKKRYAEQQLAVSDDDGNDEVKTVEDYLNDSKVDYAQNTVNILNECPELVKQLDPERFLPYLLNGKEADDKGYFGSEIFIGKSNKTGTSFHCADGENLFYMLEGKKRWTLVSPEYTWLMHPVFNKDMAYVASDISREILHRKDILNKLYPLFQHAPRYVVDLEPGDVLFNPSWYWHQVENLTDDTIAVATRWMTDIKVTNRLFSMMECFSGYSHNLLTELINCDFDYVYTDDLMRNSSLSGFGNIMGFGSEQKAEAHLDKRRQRAEQVLTPEQAEFVAKVKPIA